MNNMKLHIADQVIDIEAGEGRIRFDLIKDAMEETNPEVVAPVETPVVPEVAEDAGVQAPAPEVPPVPPVEDTVNG